jgi:hypothetical protein
MLLSRKHFEQVSTRHEEKVFEVESGGNFAVGEGESGRGGTDIKGSFVEVGLAAGALRGEGDGFVDGEREDGSEEEVGGFDASSIGMCKGIHKGKDTETPEPSGQADDGEGLGVNEMDG